jgi:uncharacterized protein YecT (DUF1311 family)/surface antigen
MRRSRRAIGVLALLATLSVGLAGAQPASMDHTFSDRLIINRVLRERLESGQSHQPFDWHNPQTGHGGRVTVFPTTQKDGMPCRGYEFTWTIGSQTTRYRGNPCRDTTGRWLAADEVQVPVEPPALELVSVGTPASFDCRNASRLEEKLICSDAQAAAADAEMGRRFQTVHNSTNADKRGELQREQSEWLRLRRRECRITSTTTVTTREQAQQLIVCLMTQTNARATALQTRIAEAPAPPKVTEAPALPKVTEAPALPKITEAPALPKVTEAPALPKITEAPAPPKIPGVPALPKIPEVPAPPKIPEVPAKAVNKDSDLAVRIKQNLSRLAYLPGAGDGIAPAALKNAIREFQRDERLAVDGKLSEAIVDRSRLTIERTRVVDACGVGNNHGKRRVCGRVGGQ